MERALAYALFYLMVKTTWEMTCGMSSYRILIYCQMKLTRNIFKSLQYPMDKQEMKKRLSKNIYENLVRNKSLMHTHRFSEVEIDSIPDIQPGLSLDR